MDEKRKGCPACGKLHTLYEPCDFGKRCVRCGLVIRSESSLCNDCFRRVRESGESPPAGR